ncbi:MAG: hypothetical protein AAF682_20030 [Planctomycetota bacterium]
MAGIRAGVALALTPFVWAAGADVPHQELAESYLERCGLSASADALDPEAVLAASFARLDLGAFELLFPAAALADATACERFQAASTAVLEGHATWVDWVDPAGERVSHKDLAKDVKTLKRWIGGWSAKELGAVPAGGELGALLPAKDKERQALERFNAALAGAAVVPRSDAGVTEAAAGATPTPAARLVLVPDRRGFVELCSVLGLLREDQRHVYWGDVASWVEFRFDDTRVVALEFSADDPEHFELGTPMDERNPKGLEQQVTQLAFASLSLAVFDNRIDPDFSMSLCNNLVIDLYGQVDTRTDGDLRPRSAPPRKVFVPGGLSQGGSLPTNSAESPWRATLGSDYFVGVLRDAQKKGAKEAGERKAIARFRIFADDGTTTFVAKPPFFGEAASDTIVPGASFTGDWLELQRTYRVAFCHWLRGHGAGKEKASKAAFGEFLTRLADAGEEADFAALLEEVYRTPISRSDPGKDDLEGRFLTWLSKQR